MAPYTSEPSHSQQVALALTPKFAAGLSLLGSFYIIFDVCRLAQTNRSGSTVYHRVMVGLSLCDMMMSSCLFTSTWGMPKDTPYVWGAKGNTLSCEAVGFFCQMGIGAVVYNATLSWYYVLRIKYGLRDEQMRCHEIFMHAIPLFCGFSTMTAGLVLDLYNSGIFDCWIAPYPQDCKESWMNGGVTTCIRGDNASLYQWVFDFIPKMLGILVVTVNMYLTYRAVRNQELKALSYTTQYTTQSQPEGASDKKKKPELKTSQMLARQSYWYVGALYVVWMPVFITRAVQLATGVTHYELLLWISITIPIQGFLNLLVYLRPRYLKAKAAKRKAAESQARATSGVSRTQEFTTLSQPPQAASSNFDSPDQHDVGKAMLLQEDEDNQDQGKTPAFDLGVHQPEEDDLVESFDDERHNPKRTS